MDTVTDLGARRGRGRPRKEGTRVEFKLPTTQLEAIDGECARLGMARSDWIAGLVDWWFAHSHTLDVHPAPAQVRVTVDLGDLASFVRDDAAASGIPPEDYLRRLVDWWQTRQQS